jgi:hypothetical protein
VRQIRHRYLSQLYLPSSIIWWRISQWFILQWNPDLRDPYFTFSHI